MTLILFLLRRKQFLILLQVLIIVSNLKNYQALSHISGHYRQDELSNSHFPSVKNTVEAVMLSNLVYYLKGCSPKDLPPEFPSNLFCEYYEEKKDGTQVAVIRSDENKYIAVVYAGTDSTVDILHDADLKAVRFGPEGEPLVNNKHVKVYAGFNEQVFGDGLYDRLLAFISDSMLNKYPSYRLFVTGHSLGGANSILTSVAFAIAFSSSDRNITVENVSVASPRTGTEAFRNFTNNLNNLSLWRIVLKDDIVPRLPPSMFYWKHPGHTIHMTSKGISCYYLHYGDDHLGYAGVPFPWNDVPYLDPIYGCINHHIQKYIDYVKMRESSTKNTNDPFVNAFVTSKDGALLLDDFQDAYYDIVVDSQEISSS
jgi:hypothetical protein